MLCVDVWDGVGEYSVRTLKQAVASEKESGGFDGIFQEPLVIYSPRRSRRSSIEFWGGRAFRSFNPWLPP